MSTSLALPHLASVRPAHTVGVDALTSPALPGVIVWALLAGSAAAWLVHRYRASADEEFAELGDATCDRCHAIARPIDAAPGRALRCPNCHALRPATWALTQASVLLGSLAMLATWGPRLALLPFLWLVPVVVVAAMIDLRTMLIPARVVWVGFGVGLTAIAAVALWSENLGSLVRALIGAVGLFVFLFVTHTISPRGMGFGDVRFAAVLGLYLGWIDIRLPLIGLVLGNLVYLAYAIPSRLRRGAAKHSPFGPGLAAGTLIAVFFWQTLAPPLT